MKRTDLQLTLSLSLTLILSVSLATQAQQTQQQAAKILDAANVKGGFIVHIGCGNGRLTAARSAIHGECS